MAMRLLLVAVAVLALAACGGGSGKKGDAKSVVADAYAKTLKANGLVSVEILLRRSNGTQVNAYSEDGSFSPNGSALRIDRTPIGGGISHEILIRAGDKFTLYVDASPTPLAKGKKWLAVDLTGFAQKRYGLPLTSVISADRNPVGPGALLGSSVATVKDVGPDNLPVNVPVEHYQGTVSLYEAAKAAGVKGKALATLQQDVGRKIQTIDVWVDEQGRIKQMVVSAPEQSASGTNFTLRETVIFRDFGQGGKVEAPPASLVQTYAG